MPGVDTYPQIWMNPILQGQLTRVFLRHTTRTVVRSHKKERKMAHLIIWIGSSERLSWGEDRSESVTLSRRALPHKQHVIGALEGEVPKKGAVEWPGIGIENDRPAGWISFRAAQRSRCGGRWAGPAGGRVHKSAESVYTCLGLFWSVVASAV